MITLSWRQVQQNMDTGTTKHGYRYRAKNLKNSEEFKYNKNWNLDCETSSNRADFNGSDHLSILKAIIYGGRDQPF